MDLLYPLGSGSRWNNNELRFSIRSAFKNLSGFRNIFIVGEKPDFLNLTDEIDGHRIIFLPMPDIYGPNNADGNIIAKLLHTAHHPMLSEDFIFMNDDNYFLKPIHVTNITPFHKGNINEIDPELFVGVWGRRLGLTRQALQQKGLTPLHFDHHAPFPMKKNQLMPTYDEFHFDHGIGLTVKSIYGSMHYKDAPLMNDEKIMFRATFSLDLIRKRCTNCLYLAHNDEGLTSAMKYFLWENFPTPSPFETSPIKDKIVNIAEWNAAGMPYETGSLLYVEYIPMKKNLHKLFLNNDTWLINKKIRYHLNKVINNL